MNPFLDKLTDVLTAVRESEGDALDAASDRMADALADGRLVHLFGSGHSVLPTQDAFPRYGGFVGLHPLTDPRVMWHDVLGSGGVRELLWLERTEGYIDKYLSHEALLAGDVLIAISHGGRNCAAIEASMYARERGMQVVAITSKANFARPAEHSTGKRLADVADVVIDTHVPIEDALVTVDGWSRPVGGASTIVAMSIVHELNVRTAQKLSARGIELPTFVSPTVPGASLASNDEVFDVHEELMARVAREKIEARKG
jgi:uncharacterized phosphosugar-binding protein